MYLMSACAAGEFGALHALTFNEQSQQDNFLLPARSDCQQRQRNTSEEVSNRVKRGKWKVSGQISFDGTGSSHPPALAKCTSTKTQL